MAPLPSRRSNPRVENYSPPSDDDSDDMDEEALIELAATHFGSSKKEKKDRTFNVFNNDNNRAKRRDNNINSKSQLLRSGDLSTGGRRYSRRSSRRASHRSFAAESESSASSNVTIWRHNGGIPNNQPEGCYNNTPETHLFSGNTSNVSHYAGGNDNMGRSSFGDFVNSNQSRPNHLRDPSNGQATYDAPNLPLGSHGFQTSSLDDRHVGETHQFAPRWNQQPFRNTHSHDDDDDDEIAQFSMNLPQEYQRLSGRQSLPKRAPIHRNSARTSTLSVDSTLIPGKMSGAISRKRKSQTDIAMAAAEATRYFNDLSDSDEYYSSIHDDDSQCLTHCSRRSSATKRTSSTQQTNTTKRSSGASTTGFSRLSLHNTYIEERPRKRRSSSSSISRMDDSVQRLSARGSYTSNMYGGNTSVAAYNAASAAVAAEEASQRLSQAMEQSYDGDECTEMTSEFPNPRRNFKRRAGFVVSTIEAEAAAALKTRTELLMKDRYETRKAKQRPLANRRSMSYTSGIRKASSIIASSMPEDGESIIMDNPEVKTDLLNLARNRMERRLHSMPDQSAVNRLSQTSLNEDVDFTSSDKHHSSGLSANLEASTAALRRSYNDRLFASKDFDPASFRSATAGLQTQRNQFDFNPTFPAQSHQHRTSANSVNDPHLPLHAQHNNSGMMGQKNHFTSDQQQEEQSKNVPQDISILAPSLQVAAEVFNTNALAAQSLAQTAQVAIAMLQDAEQKISAAASRQKSGSWDNTMSLSDDQCGSNSIDYESYDGKVTHIEPIEPDTPEEVRISELIHEAARTDDVEAIETVVKSIKEATRMVLNDTDTGDAALHIATRSGSHNAIKALLEIDAESALLRNSLGNTPLHIGVDEGILAETITICCKAPSSAKIQCEEGFLPLHNAVSTGARHPDAPQISAILLNAFEGAVYVTNDEGLLPIHIASMYGFTAGIRTLLSAKFETIDFRENIENMLPLDFAVDGFKEENSSLKMDEDEEDHVSQKSNHDSNTDHKASIELILASTLYDRVISVPRQAGDGYPFLPLHGAAKARPTVDSWNTLLSLYSENAIDTDQNGCTVTHLICSHEKDESDFEKDLGMLANVDQGTFLMFDNDGFQPLHRALTNSDVPLAFIKAVIDRENSALTQVSRSNNKSSLENLLPVQVAAAYDCELGIIFELLKSTVGILR